jgi:hypothetical protein
MNMPFKRHFIALRNFSLTAVVAASLLAGACTKSADKQSEANDRDGSAEVAANNDGFEQIFNGKDLNGWDGDTTYWSVRDGSLVGTITPSTLLKTNSFIIWRGGTTEDFELIADFRITESGNSGINYRSEQLTDVPNALKGYQADIDGKNNYTGQNYEERKRTTLAYRGEKVVISSQPNPEKEGSLKENVKNNCWMSREVTGALGDKDSLKAVIRVNDWNTCHIIAKGNHLQHYINDVLMSDVTDDDEANRKMSGLLGVQVHVGGPMTVEYRNIRLKKL